MFRSGHFGRIEMSLHPARVTLLKEDRSLNRAVRILNNVGTLDELARGLQGYQITA